MDNPDLITHDRLQALLDGIPLHRTHSLRITPTEDGATLTGSLDDFDRRNVGYDQAHGGIIAALLDTATTFGAIAVDGRAWSTVDLRIDYLRPLPLGPITLRATATKLGRRITRMHGELCDVEQRLVATAVATLSA